MFFELRMNQFIAPFDVILLDMGLTFMFDGDRFSSGERYGATYRHLGGQRFADAEVYEIISTLFEQLRAYSCDRRYFDRFPSVFDSLADFAKLKGAPANEVRLLELVFATHEIGHVPTSHTTALRQLKETHRLGVVSNIWSQSDLYIEEFRRVGIQDMFDVIVFSSDYGSIKPSSKLFRQAMGALNVDRSKIAFVGDSLERDIAGAKSIGLSTIWISETNTSVDSIAVRPDLVIGDLRELLAD